MTKVINKTMILINGKEAIAKEIDLIGRAGAKMDQRIHTAAASCVNHIMQHGDSTPLLRLYRILPNSYRKNSFLAWCVDLAGVVVITKDEEGKTLKPDQYTFKKSMDVTDEMLQAAIANNPLTYKKGSEGGAYAGFDLRDKIGEIVRQAKVAQKKVADGKATADSVKIDADILLLLDGFAKTGKASVPTNMIN